MKNSLDDFCKNIIKESENINAPIVISIVGGSCVGKSTFIHKLARSFNDSQVLHQDDYQLGSRFLSRKESKYKWDDPENFQINRCFVDLKLLLRGKRITVPVFDLKQNISLKTQVINPRKINIFEGIYSLFPPLNTIVSYSLYIEVPFYVRFLRRIHRFITTKQNLDLSIPVQHMATFVRLAHHEYVVKQKVHASLVLRGDESIPKFLEIDFKILPEMTKNILFKNRIFTIALYSDEEKKKYLLILQNKHAVYCEIVSDEVALCLENINWMEL